MIKYLKLKFADLSISSKINTIVCVFIVSFVVTCGSSYFLVNTIRSANNFASVLQANNAILQRMTYYNEELRSNFYKAALYLKFNVDKDKSVSLIQENSDKLYQMTDRLLSSKLDFIDKDTIDGISKLTKRVMTLDINDFNDISLKPDDNKNMEHLIRNFEENFTTLSGLHIKVRDLMYKQTFGMGNEIINHIILLNKVLVSIFLVIMVCFVPFVILVRYSITSPIAKISIDLESLINVDKNAKSVDVGGNELTKITHLFQIFKENEIKIKQTLKEVAEKSNKVKELEGYINDFKQSSSDIIKDLTSESYNLKNVAEAVVSIADSLFIDSEQVTKSSNDVRDNVKFLADNSEHLSEAIDDINSQIDDSMKIINVSVEKSQFASSHVFVLQESSNKISAITEMISRIASQIKLLALNATIESARAGEAGRGFSVVASEVKSLSLQTSKEIEQISKQISDVQKNSKLVENSIKEIASSVNEINSIEATISSAINVQSQNTKEISNKASYSYDNATKVLNIIENFVKNATKVKDNSTLLFKSVTVVREKSTKINKEIEDFLSNIQSS